MARKRHRKKGGDDAPAEASPNGDAETSPEPGDREASRAPSGSSEPSAKPAADEPPAAGSGASDEPTASASANAPGEPAASPRRPAPSLRPLLILLAIAPILIVVYAEVLRAPFVYDDLAVIVRNDVLERGTWSEVAWQRPTRALVNVSFAAQRRWHGIERDEWGGIPLPWHLTNVLLHAAAAALAGLLVRSLLRTPVYDGAAGARMPETRIAAILPAAAAALFALHPIATESVAYVVRRYELAMAVFYLGSLWAYVEGRLAMRRHGGRSARTWALGLTAVLAATAAMLCKEPAATIVIAVIAIDALFFEASVRDVIRTRFQIYVPFVAVVFAILLALVIAFDDFPALRTFYRALLGDASPFDFSRSEYLFTQAWVIPFVYGRLLLVPLGQSVDHGVEHVTLLESRLVIGLLALAAIAAAGVAARRRSRLGAFVVLWFFVQLSLSSTVIPLNELAAEHRVYLASLAWAIGLPLLVAAGARAAGADAERTGRAVAVLALVACLGYAGLTFRRNKVWTSPLAVWQDVLDRHPDSPRALASLGQHYLDVGRYDDAVEVLRKVLETHENPESWNNLGKTYLEMDQLDRAQGALDRALAMRPGYDLAHHNLGRVHWERARTLVREANLARQQGRAAEADETARQAAEPFEKAVDHLSRAVASNASFVTGWFNLGQAAREAGRYDIAADAFERVLQLDAGNGPAAYLLGDTFLLSTYRIIRELEAAEQRGQELTPEELDSSFERILPRVASGEEWLEHARTVDPQAAKSVDRRLEEIAKIYGALADYFIPRNDDMAAIALRRFLERRPDEVARLNQLGRIYEGIAERAAAEDDGPRTDAARRDALATIRRSLTADPEQADRDELEVRARALEEALGP